MMDLVGCVLEAIDPDIEELLFRHQTDIWKDLILISD